MDMSELAKRSAVALKAKKWADLESISRELLSMLRLDPNVNELDLRKVARNYLAAIVGEGKFLTTSDPIGLTHFNEGIQSFQTFLRANPVEFTSKVRPEIKKIQQVQLFLTQPRSDSLNKAASSLRRLGRPHLAIELANKELSNSRLNYYSLVVRGSAFVDLNQIDFAIADGELSLKHSLSEKKNYSLTLLARAYREKFKRDGLIDDGQEALKYATQALKVDRNPYIARVFISIVRTLGSTEFEELIAELKASLNFNFDSADLLAVEISNSILQSTEVENVIHEDPWDFDSVDDDGEWLNAENEEVGDSISDYFEDYFEEYADSLDNPRMPHLEP